MNKLAAVGVAGLVLLGGAVAAPAAFADDTTTPCSTALLAQADLDAQIRAAVAADKAAADAQALYDTLAAAQKEEAAAIAADNATVPPLTEDSQRTKDAKAATVAAQKAVTAFEGKGVTIEQLRTEARKTDADALRTKFADAVRRASEACRGQDVAVPSAPQVTTVPRAIDTGEA